MYKLITAEEAVSFVQDRDIVAFNGQVRFAVPELFYQTLAKRYRETGSPRGITHIASSSFPILETFASPDCKGLLSKIIVAHWTGIPKFHDAVNANELEAYSLSQGVIALNYDAAASRIPGFLSRSGVGTSIDPRVGNCGLNEISTHDFATPVTIEGEDFLFYHTITPNICVLRGTTCDAEGNISMEREAGFYDALSMALAGHNNGGKVIVQVERIIEGHTNPHDVIVPGCLVDYVYVDPDQVMMDNCVYDPIFAGNARIPDAEMPAYIDSITERNLKSRKRPDIVVARRAALELNKGDVLNIGIGRPMLMVYEAHAIGRPIDTMTFTVECGTVGGIPVGYTFGANANVSAFIPQAQLFRLYEGQGIDVTGVGALEIDASGNVNVLKTGKKLIGLGGFNHVSIAPKKLLVMTRLMLGSDIEEENGTLRFTDGFKTKFRNRIEHVSFKGDIARACGEKVLYITERAVFRLAESGLELIEYAPGLDIERDILAKMEFRPAVSPDAKPMPDICFTL